MSAAVVPRTIRGVPRSRRSLRSAVLLDDPATSRDDLGQSEVSRPPNSKIQGRAAVPSTHRLTSKYVDSSPLNHHLPAEHRPAYTTGRDFGGYSPRCT